MQQPNISALPWSLAPWKHGIISIVSADDTIIGETANRNSSADADLIVRAVNAHDALVEACKEELEIYDGMDKATLRPTTLARIERLRAALEKAGA